MDSSTVTYLNTLNQEFYRITAPHFNATRQQPWSGWWRLGPYLLYKLQHQPLLRVLDVGCGNGRFALFLHELLQDEALHYTGLDSDSTLLHYAQNALESAEIPHMLIEQDILQTPLPDTQYDLIVLFGVVHHIPGWQNRLDLLVRAARHLAVGGLLVFASWQFLDVYNLRKRIAPWPDDLTREPNDFLLDWRRGERALRYCHYVDDDEQQQLIEATNLTLLAQYRADGRTDALNHYAVLRNNNG